MPAQPPFKPGETYDTPLPLGEEFQFRKWVTDNKVPFDPLSDGPSDYDMRGYWQGLQRGQPMAEPTQVNQYDGRPHFTDYYKTPLHKAFAGPGGPYATGSQWAGPDAPQWLNDHQLATPNGRIILDDSKPSSALASMFQQRGSNGR